MGLSDAQSRQPRVEIEVPIPEIGLAPALAKLLRITARHDVAVPLVGPLVQPERPANSDGVMR